MIICIGCRHDIQQGPHALGCQVTRRIVSDARLAEALLKRGAI